MTAAFKAREVTELLEVFVEVIGHDGLPHHVGPFRSRVQAEEWIEQNPIDRQIVPEQLEENIPASNFAKLRARPAD